MRASSLAFLALATDGLVKLPLALPLPVLPEPLLAALAELAAAKALNKFPLLGFLLKPVLLNVGPPIDIVRSRSTRFRNGLGRFSSSEKSYSGGDEDNCGTDVVLFVVTPVDVEGRFVLDEDTLFTGEDRPDGSEVDAGSPGRCADRRMDGRRNRDGATTVDDGCDWVPEIDADGAFPRSRIEGEGGGPSISESESPSWQASSLSPKSKILAKFRPTLGEFTNKLASSVGAGVASASPVEVKITPFIADASYSPGSWAKLRLIGVSKPEGMNFCFASGTDRVRWCVSVIRTSGARRFFTSSRGVLSFRPMR